MSINLGNDGIQAARNLRMDPNFAALRAAIGEFLSKKYDSVLDSAIEDRVDTAAYVRGVRDVYVAIEAAVTEQMHRSVKTPKPSNRARTHGDLTATEEILG
jgi:hypothetical protein